MLLLRRWKSLLSVLKRETYALYHACRDPQCPWYARVLAAGVVAYALSPIDLIPDFIPVLGLLDDLIIVPLGIVVMRRLMPSKLMERARRHATAELACGRANPVVRAGAIAIVAMWLLVSWLIIRSLPVMF